MKERELKMSTVLFPAGVKVDFRDVSMEVMEYYAREWNLERIQMQKGFFRGSVVVTHTPRMQLMRTPHSHGLLIRGDFPIDTILIAFIMTKADIMFGNKITDRHEIKILKSGEEIDFLCNGASETFTIAAQEQFFYEAYYAYFGQDFHTYKKDKKIYIDHKSFPEFIQGFEQWMNYLMQDHNALHIDKCYEETELEILTHVFSHIHLDDAQKLRKKFQINKARDMMHQSIHDPLSIKDFAHELKISERLLRHAFKTNYGVPPKQYLSCLRMHHVKQDFLQSHPSLTTISTIIEKYGFTNQSTFTQAYKDMFGVLPSKIFNKR